MGKLMKTVVAMIVAILLVLMSGCGEEEELAGRRTAPLTIIIEGNNNFTEEMIEQIDVSKNSRSGDEDYWLYSEHKISEISEFYSLDNLKIDGYEPYLVNIRGDSFLFKYTPQNGNEHIFDADIMIGICRPEGWYGTSDPKEVFDVRINQAQEQGWGRLTEDGMIYSASLNDIAVQIGKTLLSIRVPDEFDTYEYLRDLAFEVIKTAELIDVERELARMERR
jgi:hypothetical protein